MNNLLLILLEPDTYLWLAALLLAFLTLSLLLLWRRSCLASDQRSSGRRRWLPRTLAVVLLFLWYVFLYGSFVGVRPLEVRHIEFASKDLPAAFDGYRIVQFSDAHIPSYKGWRRELLRQVVDSINAQHGDLIAFTGDLQNKEPSEIAPFHSELARLKAKDGVYSVLGNHDYAMYLDVDIYQQARNLEATVDCETQAGWHVLVNQWHKVRRGGDSIYIAGMENDGEGRFPQLGDLTRALHGLSREAFVVMLEHDPTSWRRKILPHSHCQLTLSGHTHGGQLSLLGWSPASLRCHEYAGLYYMGDRAINVSTGLSGVIPFRFGVPPEIVVITLRKK